MQVLPLNLAKPPVLYLKYSLVSCADTNNLASKLAIFPEAWLSLINLVPRALFPGFEGRALSLSLSRPTFKAREKRPGDEFGFVWSFDTVFRITYRRFSIAFKVNLSLSDVMLILPN